MKKILEMIETIATELREMKNEMGALLPIMIIAIGYGIIENVIL